MKFSIFSVSMPEYTPEVAAKKLKAAGYEGVEWRVIPVDPAKAGEKPSFWGNNLCTIDENTILQQIDEIKGLCQDVGLEMPALGAYAPCDAHDRVEKVVKAAALLGCPVVRINPFHYDGTIHYRELFAKTVEEYKFAESVAKEYGVKVVVETHMGNVVPTASAAYRLVSNFDPKYVGVLYDLGNMVYEGFEQYQFGLELLGEYLGHVHIKNAKWVCRESEFLKTAKWEVEAAPMWEGSANFEKFIAALKKVGYDGYLSFEDFTTTYSTDEKVVNNIQYLRSLL